MARGAFEQQTQSRWQRVRRRALPIVVGAIWLGSVGIGICALQRYSSSPAAEQVPPAVWPSASRLPRTAGKPTLVLVAHPRCPCTRATVHELGVLMARAGTLVTADVVFIRPTGVASDWERTDLWRSASEIPGVTVTTDDSGREAALFHAATSGQVVLFDGAGREIFSGGITESRGHEGDNPGVSRILSLLTHGSAERAKAPVFGCALNDPERLNEGSALATLSKDGSNRGRERP